MARPPVAARRRSGADAAAFGCRHSAQGAGATRAPQAQRTHGAVCWLGCALTPVGHAALRSSGPSWAPDSLLVPWSCASRRRCWAPRWACQWLLAFWYCWSGTSTWLPGTRRRSSIMRVSRWASWREQDKAGHTVWPACRRATQGRHKGQPERCWRFDRAAVPPAPRAAQAWWPGTWVQRLPAAAAAAPVCTCLTWVCTTMLSPCAATMLHAGCCLAGRQRRGTASPSPRAGTPPAGGLEAAQEREAEALGLLLS